MVGAGGSATTTLRRCEIVATNTSTWSTPGDGAGQQPRVSPAFALRCNRGSADQFHLRWEVPRLPAGQDLAFQRR